MSKTKSPYNLKYRPESYWEHSDPLQAILSGISGTARRRMITDFWNAGKFDQLEPGLLEDELDEGTRSRLGAFHPFFMGGEYLPQKLPGEVAIVRIQLQSTTFDVIELRARPLSDGRIGLRWVDEYESPFSAPSQSIGKPFTFKKLIAFIEATELKEVGALPMAYTCMNVDCLGWTSENIEELRYFTSYSSDFYPELANWAQSKIDECLDQALEDIAEEEEEEEESPKSCE